MSFHTENVSIFYTKRRFEMEFATLNTGARMPMEGFGVYQITDLDVCEKSVYEAIKAGYRLLDTAAAYGNESALGKAVKRAIADGLVKREDLFITTKVWVQDMHKAGDTYASVKRSLALSGLDYFDLVLLHQAIGDYFTAYRDLEKRPKTASQKPSAYPTISRPSSSTFAKTWKSSRPSTRSKRILSSPVKKTSVS